MSDQSFPRRARLDMMTAAELAITGAMHAVEAMGADARLTKAVMLLQKARSEVADYVDSGVQPAPAEEPAP